MPIIIQGLEYQLIERNPMSYIKAKRMTIPAARAIDMS